jgi:hypothetical protein
MLSPMAVHYVIQVRRSTSHFVTSKSLGVALLQAREWQEPLTALLVTLDALVAHMSMLQACICQSTNTLYFAVRRL